jgi:hypothetical protein
LIWFNPTNEAVSRFKKFHLKQLVEIARLLTIVKVVDLKLKPVSNIATIQKLYYSENATQRPGRHAFADNGK